MLFLKKGVFLYGLQPEMLWAADRANEIYERFGKDCVITSGRGDQHGSHSHHFKGLAIDLRTRHLTHQEQEQVKIQLQSTLGTEYQVVLETDHLHVEYDPASATQLVRA